MGNEKLELGGSEQISNTVSSSVAENGGEAGISGIAETMRAIEQADILGEMPSESPASVQPKTGKKGDDAKSAVKDSVGLDLETKDQRQKMPEQRIMIRKIQSKLHNEVDGLLHLVNRTNNPFEINSYMAQVRKLQMTISKLAEMGVEYVKNLYMQMFQSKKDKKGEISNKNEKKAA